MGLNFNLWSHSGGFVVTVLSTTVGNYTEKSPDVCEYYVVHDLMMTWHS